MFLRVLPLLCFIFFFITTSTARGSPSFQLTNETDHQALLTIKDLIQADPLHVLSSWNHSVHFCTWQGVTCGRQHRRVTVLKLPSLDLVGSLSPHIANLTFLKRIDLRNNSFRGAIPQEIGKLFRLQHLLLDNNSFQGELPTNLTRCSAIRVITVQDNNLEGKIPNDIGSLSNLLQLNLDRNHFTGTIPRSFQNLSSLRSLSLLQNNLEGSIPFQLGQLSKLEFLQLSSNKLSGTFPALGNISSSINLISMVENQLQGSLPQDLGLYLPKLQSFYAGGNQFDGPIPLSIANASALREIDIGYNAFTGPLPMNLGSLRDLDFLNLYGNSLGSHGGYDLNFLITSLSNCSNLGDLMLGQNGFRGLLPHSIANLSTKLTTLRLDDNYISGSIPLGIGNLVNLQSLMLSENQLTGNIPESIGKLSVLERLYAEMNNISGKIPSSFGNITSLSVLGLEDNMLEGSIPDSLANCTSLQLLDLGSNHLTGAIPEQIFYLSSLSIALSFSYNYLIGPLPLLVGKLRNLGILDVSGNKLSGEIPNTIGGCEVLEVLYMQGNLFKGAIPASFEQLKGIRVLDLSRNNLSGLIPSFLGEFTSIQNLNLSYNMFDGEVPNKGVFENISAFSIVGNNKLCGGIKALQLPLCPTKVLEKRKKHLSHGVIIPLVTTLVIVLLLLYLLVIYRIKKSKQQISTSSTSQNQFLKLSYAELLQATNGFSSTNLIGEGRYGSVYKGILNSGEQIVAIKVLKLQEHGANKSFMAEYEALRTIRHRNLIKIITSCSSLDFKGEDFKALVFEFMANGSLDSWLNQSLSEQQDPKNLSLVQRLNIAIDVANALDYLHHHCETVIIHCDLKPSNILLDDDFCAHVGDFGIAKILSTTSMSNHQPSSSIGIRGTIGYVAPEYGMGGQVSTQGDMYSYGVLLLEMFTGKMPTNSMFTSSVNLHSYVKMSLPDRIMEIIDPRIVLEEEDEPKGSMKSSTTSIAKVEDCLSSVLQIGVSCSAELPSERMDARDVLTKLHKIRNVFLGVRGGVH